MTLVSRHPLVVLAAPAYLALIACSSGSSPSSPPSATLDAGGYSLVFSAGGQSITLQSAGSTLLSFPTDAFELGVVDSLQDWESYDPFWLEHSTNGATPVQPTWLDVQSTSLTSTATTADVALDFGQGITATLSFAVAATGRFSAMLLPKVPSTGSQVAYIRLRPRASSTEAFYGMGEQEDSVDSRGQLRPMQLEGLSTTESPDNEAHFPIPLIIGTRGWGLFVQSKRVGLFDVARKADDLVEVTYGTAEQSSQGLQFHLLAADAPIDVTKLYYDITGYPRLPAQWSLGPWIRRDVDQDQAQVLDGVSKMQTLDLPTSAIWCDRRDESGVGAFDLDPTRFPDPATMIQTVHDAGLRFAVWAGPYVQSSVQPTYDEVKSKGYFPPVVGVTANGWSPPIDFTNPAAYSFWQSLIKRDIDMGVEGFEMDYAEDVFPSILRGRNVYGFFDHSDDRTMHYGYTVLYHRAYQQMLDPAGSYLLCRAGRWGDQVNVAVTWPGDMDANMVQHGQTYVDHSGMKQVGVGGLPATVVMGLTLGPSGFPFFASDTGGYRDSPPNNETFTRWFEQTALSTVMNVGDASSTEDPYSDTPWEFTPENGRNQTTLDTYRTYARLHMRLFPYEWTYAQHIAHDGRPITRAFGLVYPQLGVHPSDEYLFGDDLLVAPVVAAGATTRTLYLPPGDWVDWWQGTAYAGGSGGMKVTVPAPLATLPLFLRAGGVVPLLRPTIQRMAPTTMPTLLDSFANDSGVLYARLAPVTTATTSFEVYDGGTIAATPQQGGMAYSFKQGAVFQKGALFEAIHAPMPSSVTRAGTAFPMMASEAALEMAPSGWFWEPAIGGRLWLKIAGDGEAIVAK
jgi:alpha-D-xyloside xylohydrolase